MRKFEKSYIVKDYEVLTENGFVDVKSVHLTIPYDSWCIETKSGLRLTAADTHILFTPSNEEVFLKDLNIGDSIKTMVGEDEIVACYQLHTNGVKHTQNMYDIQVNGHNQSYYTNGILSHNTASAALYLLWYAMFNPDQTVLIAAHKGSGAMEIMDRIRYAYESCPDHIRCGTTTYTTSKIVFDNHSSIKAETTTENTGRGMSISLLYCVDGASKIRVKDKTTGEIKELSMAGLYMELDNEEVLSVEPVGTYRFKLSNGTFYDVPENVSIYADDDKKLPGDVVYGEKLNYGTGYAEILDISYLN